MLDLHIAKSCRNVQEGIMFILEPSLQELILRFLYPMI